MTPVEVLGRALSGLNLNVVIPPQVLEERLSALGFTVVPIEPTDAQVEAMARAISGSYGMGRVFHWEKEARAAYAAAIK